MLDSQQILFVSDDAPSKSTRVALEQRGFAVVFVQDFDTAYRQLHDSAFDLVILDVVRATTGIEFVKRLRGTPKLNKTLVLTIADWGTGQATLALTVGADAYEPKPLSPERLIAAVDRLVRQRVAKTAAATNVVGGIMKR
ncbi:MAG TPA: response regulator [Pyrinomonadaceae bacterium]|nr:response regulator [Pyrinomonadaceae bacterium]